MIESFLKASPSRLTVRFEARDVGTKEKNLGFL